MAGNPKEQQEQQQRLAAAAAAAAGGLGLDAAAMGPDAVLQGGIGATSAVAHVAPMLDINSHPQLAALNVTPDGAITDAAGNVIQLAGAGMQGLQLGMIDFEKLQELQAAAAAQGYAAAGMPGVQLVQLPGGELAAVPAPQQGLQDAGGLASPDGGEYGGGFGVQQQQQQQADHHQGQQQQHGEDGGSDRPAKRVRMDDESQQQQLHEQHAQLGGAEGQDAAFMAAQGGEGGDVAAMNAAAAAAAVSGGMQLHLAGQLQQLQQQHGDLNAAAAAAAAATALGTVVNVNGVNMLIPAAPQLQLQLAPDSNMHEQLQLALQQQVQLAQIPVMPGLTGIAGATPEQLAQLQQQLQIQQQIQQLQLQQQLQLMQLQLASQGGLFLGPGGRLGVDDGGNSHMVRRHGVLPERMVTREMLKQASHSSNADVVMLWFVWCVVL
jgi:hypothetical protein